MLGLLRYRESSAASLLRQSNLDLDQLKQAIEEATTDSIEQRRDGPVPYNPMAKKIVELSPQLADQLNSDTQVEVQTEHLLLALVQDKEEGVAIFLESFGVSYDGLCALDQS